jgi:hypothetical protein
LSEFEDKLQAILGDSQAMDQILSLAQSITGASPEGQASSPPPQPTPESEPEPETQTQGASPLGDLDPRLLQLGMRLLSAYNDQDDQKTALLTALRPFVRKERYAKVDRAVRLARLSRVLRVALDAFRGGEVG